jgi:3-hydroxyisobutyrate dehydrogenase-like beta-hydroxyacid dehydrogenase
MPPITGFVHPGAMGAVVAAACGGTRLWASDDRSPATRARAESAGLDDVGALAAMVVQADTIVSICPPDQALPIAREIAELGFEGIYVDANAIAPSSSEQIGTLFEHYVDGGIIGPPPVQAGTTRMYLSGPDAPAVAGRWDESLLSVHLVDGEIGAASAVKMCFAAWTKGTQALLLDIAALAEINGVTDALRAEWAISQPDHLQRSRNAARFAAPKAWRFAGEMLEIATSFADAGLPDQLHIGAADLYDRLAEFEDVAAPELEDVVAALVRSTAVPALPASPPPA